jgi:hypothetical protein
VIAEAWSAYRTSRHPIDGSLAGLEWDAFVAAFHDDFKRNGAGFLEKARQERPGEYLKVVAALMPEALATDSRGHLRELTDDGLHALIWRGLVQEGIDETRLREITAAWHRWDVPALSDGRARGE